MSNIMVCVTKQKTCQRLIDYGRNNMKDGDSLFVVHVSGSDYNFLGNSEDGKALDFLYEKAREAGASLTVYKSDDILGTLLKTIDENNITDVIVGQTGSQKVAAGFLEKLSKALKGKAQLEIVPNL